MKLKNLPLYLLLGVSTVALARHVFADASGSGWDVSTTFGANGFIKTDVNKNVPVWRPGDAVTISKNGKSYTYSYSPMIGSFVIPRKKPKIIPK